MVYSTYRILLLIVSLSVEPIGKHHCPKPAHVVHPHVEALEPADGRLGGGVAEQPAQRPPHLYSTLQCSTVQYSTEQPSHLGLRAPQPGAPCLELPSEAVQLRHRPGLCGQQTRLNLSSIWALFLISFLILSTINNSV